MMEKNEGPFRLVLNKAASSEILWHCKHYQGRGLMKHFTSGEGIAQEMGVSASVLKRTFQEYNDASKSGKDKFGLKFFLKDGYQFDDEFYVAIVCPVVHYCMGGLRLSTEAEVLNAKGKPVVGLFATGELCGGVHGKNRLGGSSLLDCVVFGRVSGASATKLLLSRASSSSGGGGSGRQQGGGNDFGIVLDHHGLSKTVISLDPEQQRVTFDVIWNQGKPGRASSSTTSTNNTSKTSTNTSTNSEVNADLQEELNARKGGGGSSSGSGQKTYSREEVAKHNNDKDCWVIVNGQVLNVTSFLKDHPGGKDAIMLFAGKEASEEFNMIHKADVVEKYAPTCIIGNIEGGGGSTSVAHSHTSGCLRSRF
jgi:cytochrome b involved in lipid metabolism